MQEGSSRILSVPASGYCSSAAPRPDPALPESSCNGYTPQPKALFSLLPVRSHNHPEKTIRQKETQDFTNFLRAESIEKDDEILSLSRLLVKTGGKIINPAVKFRNLVQTNKTWRVVERGLLNTVKRMKK